MRAAVARRLRARLGYRGAALLVCGFGWINYGVGLIDNPRFGTVHGVSALLFGGRMPISAWGVVWITSGALSVLAAFRPGARDWWGWAAAAGPPAMWAVAYSGARALSEFSQGWYSGVTWAVVPSLLLILAAATRKLLSLRRRVRGLEARLVEAVQTGGNPNGERYGH
ncbi:hypothetical protein R2B67_26330 [Streptomyces cyaneofuscatus]|uniref:hypothetical protein n=1 Tax=Streptomyces cyaneofuscatus TaxID=66883 RepID=UPI002953F8E3|nr:hypothetical protein [Streptomyces cyaneofuscatus]WOP11839.1 hypothetical protein R2B67_26330 [Streptomyces cyaneofuscatus]